jgi:FixJ family two-component response regulator
MLRQLGYASLLFPSAEAFANHRDFEKALCVILDINLNDGSSGIELRVRLKDAGNSVPVIYVTGNDTPAVRMAALQSGCLAYLTKPFSAKSLIEPLERASEGSHSTPAFARISIARHLLMAGTAPSHFPTWVNRVILVFCQPLPVYPEQRTSADRPRWSAWCQQRSFAG